ncbi:MAG: dihydrolipoyl dehydrogenase [Elusimicrobiota bacterium]
MKVIIIGSGPAGYPCALKLKQLGADVKIIENWTFGGTCLNRGCIPSKAILEIAHRYHLTKDIKDFFEGDINLLKLKWDKIKEHKTKVIEELRTSLEKLFLMKRIEVIRGKAKLAGENLIEVDSNGVKSLIEFDKLVIATGTKPFYPQPFDSYREKLTDSDKIFDMENQPESLTIIGAGVIGIEMACFFNAIGSEVKVVDIMNEILPSEDPQITKVLKNELEKRGVRFYLGQKTIDIKFEGDKKIIKLESGEEIKSSEIMLATGRVADLKELNLEAGKVKYSRFIEVDKNFKTTNPNIYAIGDVNGISLLAHSATRQGELVAENICLNKEVEFDRNIVPSCIYSFPELACVGINTKEAKEKGLNIKIKKSFYQVLGKAVATKQKQGFIQIITDENETVIGAQIVGASATEIIHILALAIKFNMKTKDLKSIIYAHPTMSEIINEAISK